MYGVDILSQRLSRLFEDQPRAPEDFLARRRYSIFEDSTHPTEESVLRRNAFPFTHSLYSSASHSPHKYDRCISHQ